MELDKLYSEVSNEIELEIPVKLPRKRLKHFFKPVYGVKTITKKLGKINIKDQLEAEKLKTSLSTQTQHISFLAWIANRLIKKCDPYWEKTDQEVLDMFTLESIKQLNSYLRGANPPATEKKKAVTDQAKT